MRIKTIGKVLAGLGLASILIGSTVVGATTPIPDKDWFVNPETGVPNVTIVVGAQANASDVVGAALIGAAIGNMATTEEVVSIKESGSVTFDKVIEYDYAYTTKVVEVGTSGYSPQNAKYYTDYELYSTQFWETSQNNYPTADYDITVALATPKEIKNPQSRVVAGELKTLWHSKSSTQWDANDKIYKGKSYQLKNQIDENGVVITTAKALVKPYAGGAYDNGDDTWDFNGYAFFDTEAWVGGTLDQELGECDYFFGGTGTAMEPHEEIQVILGDKTECDGVACVGNGITDFFGQRGMASGIVYRTTEIRYPLLENGQNICGIDISKGMVDFETTLNQRFTPIKFLGKYYTPLFAGATSYAVDEADLGAYFVYGKPYAEKEKIMQVGDTYGFHGWTIDLMDVNIYENKAYLRVNGPALTAPFTFIMVMDAMDNCITCCPECATYGGGGAFTSNPTKRNEYDPYVKYTDVEVEKDGKTYKLFTYTNFVLDGIKTFIGADGTYLAEFNLYAIEDYGYLRDKGCCDPFVTTPNDYGLAIHGGWREVAYDAETRQMLGGNEKATGTQTGYWMDWEDHTDLEGGINSAFVLWKPQSSEGFRPNTQFDTLELQLCDTITIPNCETDFTVNGPENYFTITIQDVDFGKVPVFEEGEIEYTQLDGYYNEADTSTVVTGMYTLGTTKGTDKDGAKIKIQMTSEALANQIKYTQNVKIDPLELVKLDIEVNPETIGTNLILVGGPVYNTLVKDLVDKNISTVDWFKSGGEWEWIADPYGKGNDVMIVAGANREETRQAAEDLVALM